MTRIESRYLADGERWCVLFEGTDVSDYCFMADTDTGEVGLYARNEAGDIVINPATGLVDEEIKRGQVVIQKL